MNLNGYQCDTTGCDSTLLLPKETVEDFTEDPPYKRAGWRLALLPDGKTVHTCPRCVVAPPLVRDLYAVAQQYKEIVATTEDLGFVVHECDTTSHSGDGCRYHIYYDDGHQGELGRLHARVIGFLDEWSVVVEERWEQLLGPNNEPV